MQLQAQTMKEVTGTVIDYRNNEPIIGASVQIKGTTRGAVTDENGRFTVKASEDEVLVISFIGYVTEEITITSQSTYNVSLLEDISTLQSVVVVGSRGSPRTVIESPVPIDNINAGALMQSGQVNIEQMITYRVPSYNSSNQAISDATAHFDPSELRNLGPSRTLVLVNGKRKNQSALVYVNDTPGKGEVGVDMKSIPASAIERVEVLRDGAAAQYGSDAIAGVINIVLKDYDKGSVNVSSGISQEGDGFMYDLALNKGFKLGENSFLNITANYSHQDKTNRAGEPGADGLFDVPANDPTWGDWLAANPDLGMTIGQPEFDKLSFFANYGTSYSNGNGEFYAFGGYTKRDGTSFALYRAPYWITDDAGLLTPPGQPYNGFQPTFETDINDYTFTVGNRYKFGEWKTDLSVTTGGNDVAYTIGNTINTSLLPNSPTTFDAGDYRFGSTLANLDIARTFNDNFTLYFGTEIRREVFEVGAGQPESYEGSGAQSFPGLQPSNELKENRNNVGVYAGFDWDATDNFLIGGAVRYENYSDFGGNVSWKVNARQLFADGNGAIRASVSTGFRAPSLHQIYLSNIQTIVTAGTVSNQGTFNNVDPVIRSLGVPALDAETSFNISAGITYRFNDHFSVSADYYNISIDDRVLFTGEIGQDDDPDTTNPVEQILEDNNITTLKFFVNALDTKTQGVDIIADYTNIYLGEATLDLILSMNYNKTSIEGSIDAPGIIGEVGYDIFNRKEQSRVTTARPNTKVLFGMHLEAGKFGATLNNTYFGEVTWQHADNPSFDQTFSGKVITDLILDYDIINKLNLSLTVNNLLDVYPDEIDTKGDVVTDLGGRFKYPWEVNQFGFLGRFYKVGLNYRF
ncbi:TonB-dependent receptor [Flammeovirgaceae bacterium KN852]|uniref:TonB-dependent receptor n=2 Tax=Marinigracilibium pacificum TaxID=2729599 RepID=A0A848J8D4_9BACT|nr:TonB-dependent receptor [Marinigracilibium pacificum]